MTSPSEGSRLRNAFGAVLRFLAEAVVFVQRLDAVRVRGASMEPAFRDGDLCAVRTLSPGEPEVGQVVTARVGGREVVKRVTADTIEGFFLAGDNRSASTDPGPVPLEAITGVVVYRYWPLVRLPRRRTRASGGTARS